MPRKPWVFLGQVLHFGRGLAFCSSSSPQLGCPSASGWRPELLVDGAAPAPAVPVTLQESGWEEGYGGEQGHRAPVLLCFQAQTEPRCTSLALLFLPTPVTNRLCFLSLPAVRGSPSTTSLPIPSQSPQCSQYSPLAESSLRWQVPALAWQETTSPFLRRWVQPRRREQMRAQRQSPSSRYTTSHGSCSTHTFCSSTAVGGEAVTRAAGGGGVAARALAAGQAETRCA